eukprot:g32261.t1
MFANSTVCVLGTVLVQFILPFVICCRGEVCRQIWLGLFDSRSSVIPDYRDPQKIKEFLQDKYEKKRWYVPPERVKVSAATSATTSLSSRSSTPDVKPLKTLMGDSTPALNISKSAGQ